jgi:maltose alpha-D-glucosyltransferase / alpha-amylase
MSDFMTTEADTIPSATFAVGDAQASSIDRGQSDWYRDAIIYQMHIKAFMDSNNDGIGDFAGLMQRLDYVEELGVTAIWILPFYPSPLRDDGYDISDYRSINPSYGTMEDFRAFIAEAHRRGLRVITELVINHTSDQHPWFQAARRAPPGSPEREMYVWSDSDEKYPETRIIFIDTEKSNWTWDAEAGAFFWHRFYSHQPDLNFDNPRVLEEVLEVMRMWLDMGVDGLRLDAIPYLVEREGTNNENLPETHEVLKAIRAELDRTYPDRMLLAEANQWPEDTRPYFGDGDECHMGFHFPLMPRMYMALAQADRHPITDIIRQTPEIPDGCQWGIFLRNHDELTLEMVTEDERDYLWKTYAEDARARINLGIRRRLAPLMRNDRRKIELMNSMLLTMPGTPIVYYGDEIGMGDNYYLGDRDGVRTPMQWSPDRNAGFSRANPQQLYLPTILDPIYGYEAVNVEAQANDPSSLLNWVRRMIMVRKQHRALGRGEMILLYPRNRKILAYIREHEGDTILCVANLAASAQAVELDLGRYRGYVPVELTGRSAFPPIGDLPYMLSMPGYGFYWFLLAAEEQAPSWHEPLPDVLPEFITLTSRDGRIETAITGREGAQLEKDALPYFLPLQRWFGEKGNTISSVKVVPLGELVATTFSLVAIDVTVRDETSRYFLPMSVRWGEESLRPGAPKLSYTLAKVRRGPHVGALIDGAYDENLATQLLAEMRGNHDHEGPNGVVQCRATEAFRAIEEIGDPRPLGVEQSNVSISFSDKVILKIYRRLRTGEQPDVEIARFLAEESDFQNTPAFYGAIDLVDAHAQTTTLAAAFAFYPNQGDAWAAVTEALARDLGTVEMRSTALEPPFEPEMFALPLDIGALLGQRTAELHKALAVETSNPAFAVEPIEAEHLAQWSDSTLADADGILGRLAELRGTLPEEVRGDVEKLLTARDALTERIRRVTTMKPSGGRSRIHGDYHLGQVLIAQADLAIIDFEGEPGRTLDERRAKTSPYRDVAGMLRSFDYAASMALDMHIASYETAGEAARARVLEWRETTTTSFLDAYREHVRGAGTIPEDAALGDALLDLFLIQKGLYEISYELGNRPAWIRIPLQGVLDLMEKG